MNDKTYTLQDVIDAFDQGVTAAWTTTIEAVRMRPAWLTPELVGILEMVQGAFDVGIKGRDTDETLTADAALEAAGYPKP